MAAIHQLLMAAKPAGGAAATLSSSPQTMGSSLDLSAGGYRDYYFERRTQGSALQKTGQPFITLPSETNLQFSASSTSWCDLSATDWVFAVSGSNVGTFNEATAGLMSPAAGGAWKYEISLPADTTLQTIRVHFGGKRDDGFSCPGRCKLTAALGDASASPITIVNAAAGADGTEVRERHDITFRAAGSTTLTLTFEANAGSTSVDLIMVQLIALV